MKSFSAFLALSFIISLSHAGVGGISGGHINFQRESTFVHPVYNKSLCFDGVDFHALLNKCVQWGRGDSGSCERFEKIPAVQPRVSTRKQCVDTGGGSGDCAEWKMIPFIQEPVREVEVTRGNKAVKKIKIKVKGCR